MKPLQIITVYFLLLCIDLPLAIGDGTFSNGGTYAVGDRPMAVETGDLDGDLDTDLVVVNLFTNDISVLLNNGDGTYAPHVTYPVRERPKSVAIGDLDGDNDLDLAVACRGVSSNQDGKMSILLNLGDGTFAPEVAYDTGRSPVTVAIGDLDGDADLDLAVANRNSDDVSVLLNNGNGTFGADVTYAVGGGLPTGVAIGDLNGDDFRDLAVANNLGGGGTGISVFFNIGDGTFAAPVNHDAGFGPSYVVIDDLDGDADLDLAAAGPNGDGIPVLLNNGDGTFAPHVTYGANAGPAGGLAIGNLGGNLNLDLAVTYGANNEVGVLLNNGDGTFQDSVHFGVGQSPKKLSIGNLNGDSCLDLAVPNHDDDTVSVLFNSCLTKSTADSINLVFGTQNGGVIDDTFDSDDSRYVVQAIHPFSPILPGIRMDYSFTLPNDSPNSIQVISETHTNDIGIIQDILLFNLNTATYELVDSRTPTFNQDGIAEIMVAGDVLRFVEPGTGLVRLRVETFSTGGGFLAIYELRTDEMTLRTDHNLP